MGAVTALVEHYLHVHTWLLRSSFGAARWGRYYVKLQNVSSLFLGGVCFNCFVILQAASEITISVKIINNNL